MYYYYLWRSQKLQVYKSVFFFFLLLLQCVANLSAVAMLISAISINSNSKRQAYHLILIPIISKIVNMDLTRACSPPSRPSPQPQPPGPVTPLCCSSVCTLIGGEMQEIRDLGKAVCNTACLTLRALESLFDFCPKLCGAIDPTGVIIDVPNCKKVCEGSLSACEQN